LIVVLAAAAILLASSFTTPSVAEQAKPQLRVVTLSPFVVVGTGFRPGETVRVNVRTEAGAASRKDVAGRRGGIDVRFARLKLDNCPEYMVSARETREAARQFAAFLALAESTLVQLPSGIGEGPPGGGPSN
jgi:hypothetical protein